MHDELAVEVITEEMRSLFQPAAVALAVPGSMAVEHTQPPELLSVPSDLLSIILSQLDTHGLVCLAATCRSFRCDVLTPLRWEAPLAAGFWHSLFVDRQGRVHLACCGEALRAGEVGEPLSGYDRGPAAGAPFSVPPTLVPSMQETRIVSAAGGGCHCLALSVKGEVYSWGEATHGALGHADESARYGPRCIETLKNVERIWAGSASISAAVDDRGRLFTWGLARWRGKPAGLGYELDPVTMFQPSPNRVYALAQERVVGVAFGHGWILVVTVAGAVFSFGSSPYGALGCMSTSEVLPRRIEALAETGRRFVSVAAGEDQALALTEEGHVYGWGYEIANGHGWALTPQGQITPQRVAALAGERVKLVYAHGITSCAVTEKGEIFTWGGGLPNTFNLGHGVDSAQPTPKRVEALRRVKVAAAAICLSHTLVADEDGVVWGIGKRSDLGFGNADLPHGGIAVQPTLIPNLRVRTLWP